MINMAQGDSPISGLVSSTSSSIISGGLEHLGSGAGGLYIGGLLSGGMGARVAGGDFWDGAGRGLIVAGLNHAAHLIGTSNDPPWLKRMIRQREAEALAALLC